MEFHTLGRFVIHSFKQYTFIEMVVNQDRVRLYSHRTYIPDAEIDIKQVNTY